MEEIPMINTPVYIIVNTTSVITTDVTTRLKCCCFCISLQFKLIWRLRWALQVSVWSVTSLCRTRSPSGLASEPREDVLEMDERRLLQSEARGERLGD